MSDAAPLRPARTLPFIPLEICEILAGHLDRSSARSLIRTCTALKPAGEAKLFSRLDLTGVWDPEAWSQTTSLDPEGYRARAAIVDAKLSNLLAMFERYPYLLEYARTVRIEPSDGTADHPRAKELVKLLKLVSPHITRLDVLPLPSSPLLTSNESDCESIRFFQALPPANISFPRLIHLKLALPALCPDESVKWLEGAPALQELEFSSADGNFCFPATAIDDFPRKPFLHLHTFTMDHLYAVDRQYGLDYLAGWLGIVPNLHTLRIRGEWVPMSGQPALEALGKLGKLKRLVTVDEDFMRDDVAEGIAYQRFGKVELFLEEAAMNLPSWVEHDEVYFENIAYAKAPNLQRMTILTMPRPLASDLASIPLAPTPLQTIHIHPWFLHRIQRSPSLEWILFQYLLVCFPNVNMTDFVEPELFIPPERWVEEGHRGLILRQYRDPDTKDEFWHLRSLGRARQTEGLVAYVGARRMWQDHTSFRGRTVPRHILDRVYEAIGETSEFLSGGREISLGEKGSVAWDILHEWREEAGEGSDVEDEALMNGEEDEDILSGEE